MSPISPSSVSIQLTRSQIDQIVRRSSDADGLTSILQGLSNRDLEADYPTLSASPRLSRSLLLGLLVLACFPTDGRALAVTDVATHLQLSPSTTHRYMTTLLAAGLLEQDPQSRRYHVPLAV